MIIFESPLTTFEAALFFEAAGAVSKNGSSLKSKPPLADLALLNP